MKWWFICTKNIYKKNSQILKKIQITSFVKKMLEPKKKKKKNYTTFTTTSAIQGKN